MSGSLTSRGLAFVGRHVDPGGTVWIAVYDVLRSQGVGLRPLLQGPGPENGPRVLSCGSYQQVPKAMLSSVGAAVPT